MLVPSAQAAIMIQGDVKLGRFEVKRDGTLQERSRRLGDPRRCGATIVSERSATRVGQGSVCGSPSTTSEGRTRAGRSGATSRTRRSSDEIGRREPIFGSAIHFAGSGPATRVPNRTRRTCGSSSDDRHSGIAGATPGSQRRSGTAGSWRSSCATRPEAISGDGSITDSVASRLGLQCADSSFQR
jgi:hypothetical protein